VRVLPGAGDAPAGCVAVGGAVVRSHDKGVGVCALTRRGRAHPVGTGAVVQAARTPRQRVAPRCFERRRGALCALGRTVRRHVRRVGRPRRCGLLDCSRSTRRCRFERDVHFAASEAGKVVRAGRRLDPHPARTGLCASERWRSDGSRRPRRGRRPDCPAGDAVRSGTERRGPLLRGAGLWHGSRGPPCDLAFTLESAPFVADMDA
jgi:hypothetical protein